MGRDSSELRGRVSFLVGARRSGTNWLHSLMTLHPRLVKVPSETHLFYTLAQLEPRFQHGLIGSANTAAIYLPRKEMLDGFRDLCDRAFAIQMQTYGGPGQILVERTPLHAQHLDLVGDVYPDAHVVHLIRDGRDVAASLVRQSWGPESLAAAAAEWVETVTKARAAQPPLYCEVRHEDLVADVAGEMGRLFRVLGLDVSAELLDRIRAAAPRPVNTTTDGHAAGSTWREQLDGSQVAEIEEVAGDLLTELGYRVGERPQTTAERVRRSAGFLRGRGGSRLAATARRASTAVPAKSATGDRIQYLVDRTLAALEASDAEALATLLSPRVEVRLHDTGEVMSGSDRLAQVAAALIDAASPSGRQVRGDSYPGSPSFTIVWAHDDAAGRVHRVFVVAVDSSELIAQVDYYQMPQPVSLGTSDDPQPGVRQL